MLHLLPVVQKIVQCHHWYCMKSGLVCTHLDSFWKLYRHLRDQHVYISRPNFGKNGGSVVFPFSTPQHFAAASSQHPGRPGKSQKAQGEEGGNRAHAVGFHKYRCTSMDAICMSQAVDALHDVDLILYQRWSRHRLILAHCLLASLARQS